MTALVIAEHDHTALNPATLATVTAAVQMGGGVDMLIAGSHCRAVAEAAQSVAGIGKVLLCDNPLYAHPLAENLAPLIAGLAGNYSHLVAPASTTGKDVMPRVAALLDIQQVSEITKVEASDTFVRPIYAGNALETVHSAQAKQVVTVRPTAFDKAAANGGTATLEEILPAADAGLSRFLDMQTTASDRPDQASARVVISGGRGLGSAENFKLLERIADKLGAALGASRAAVDAGYVPNDYQIGQTGKVVAPELYIAVGISGAIQHLAGMKESKVIVAINKDENAPIFEIADYGLVADLFDVLPKLEAQL